MGRWSYNWVTDRAQAVAIAMLLCLDVAGCGRGGDPSSAATLDGDSAVTGNLPAPEGVPGTSVTGMPVGGPPVIAAPPVQTPVAPEASGATTATLPGNDAVVPLPAPVDITEANAAAPGPDPAGAAAAMRDYMAALASGAFARAQQAWGTAPGDADVLQLARGRTFEVSIGAASAATDTQGIDIPVDMRGTTDDGAERRMTAVYRLQPDAGQWRIVAVSIREAAP
ncbi:MAG: hypothetical protein EPO46_04840 [Lysobacter sp.]|nr:MAG: hypothetical protein EPO46_04840 [Lysobacter sp.]